MKHFKLTSETKIHLGVTLYRIEATIDLPRHGVKCGDKGGWVEKESNISGNAWISGNAQISGDAQISVDAQISGDAWIYGDAWISGNARISGNAWISGNARISDNAWIYGNARISDNARISGNAWISGNAQISGNAWIYGDAHISGNAWIYGDAWIYGNAWIYGDAQIYGDAHVDCLGAIFWFTVTTFYTVTITRKLIFIGCKQIKRTEVKTMTKEKAVSMGMPEHLYDPVLRMIKAGMKIVPRESKGGGV